MRLNHLDLPVADTRATADFFKQHFGFKLAFSRDDGLIVLLDEDGFALTLSPLVQRETAQYPTGFHLGFNVDSEDILFDAHQTMCAAGVPIVRPMGDLAGAMTFHCLAPGPILVEISYRARPERLS